MPGPFPDSMMWATQQQRDAYLDAQSAAAAKQYDQQQAAEKEQQQQKATPLAPHQELIQRVSNVPAKVTPSYLDDMLHYVDSFAHDGSWGEAATRVGRDLTVAGSNAVINTAGAVGDFAEAMDRGRAEKDYAETGGKGMSQIEQQRALEAEDPAMEARDRAMGDDTRTLDYGSSPIWNHAKQAILDFRDHMQLQDPNAVDRFTQLGAQLAIPFMGASKLLEGIHIAALENAPAEVSAMQDFGPYLVKTAVRDATMLAQKAGRFAKNVMVPGAAVDATALAPHAPRFADTLALIRQTEGKFGEALRAVGPYGLNSYIDYLTEPDESAAAGRFKNMLDGAGVNAAFSGLLQAVAPVLKQGTAGLRYLADNGVMSMGDFPRPPAARQTGKIVFHGTPHDFDEFDDAKIGTGEGAQAYGHGLYFAEEPGVARSYIRAGGPYLEHNGVRVHAEEWDDPAAPPKMAVKDLLLVGTKDRGLSHDAAQSWAEQQIKTKAADWGLKTRDQQMAALDLLRQTKLAKGNFLHVDIPDDKIGQMLDHDKLMGQQPDVLDKLPPEDRGQLEALLDENGHSPDLEEYTGGQLRQLIERGINEDRLNFTPRDGNYDNPSKNASEYLADHGIPGIKYLDEKSRDPRLFVDGKPYAAQGPTEEQAINLVRQTGSVRKAIGKAERLGWNKPEAFYQDREKYEALKALEAKGAEYKAEGSRNLVLFNARDAKVAEKH